MSFIDDKELNEYRDIMKPPEVGKFEDGFNWKTVAGAFFLGFIMMPASEYLGLVVGPEAHIQDAARWVTIILFAELSKRSFKDLKMQELYILHFMTGLAMAMPFEGFLWKQFMVQSDFAKGMGIAQELPWWAFPSAESIGIYGRTFFTWEWLPVIALTMFGLLISKVDTYGLGYVLYRLVNDVEKLPFPFAPVNAAGIVALSSSRDESQSWRWRSFSIGGMIGMAWALIYIAVPVISETLLQKRIEIIPLVYIDLTPQVSNWLPAFPFNLVLSLGTFMSGMMVPFWSVVGGVFGVVFTMVANPILYKEGILSHWRPEMGFIDTMFMNDIDFYMSFTIGITLSITLMSILIALKYMFTSSTKDPKKQELKTGDDWLIRLKAGWKTLVTNNVERGDFSIYIGVLIYVVTSTTWILLGAILVPGYPWPIFVFYALIYTPLISYATAKLEGICGRAVQIPYLKELTIILSGHKGVDIWFAPIPIQNLGVATVGFRTLELCGTKIKSQVKTLILTTPIVIIASLLASQLLWKMAPIPSDAYPYTQKMWDLILKRQLLMFSATMEGGSIFMEAFQAKWLYWGLGTGSGIFILLSAFGAPVMLVFGAVWGLAQSSPGAIMWQLCGALVARFYFKRKFKDMWLKYMSVILAGFGCGMGLISMVAFSFTIITKMLSPLAF